MELLDFFYPQWAQIRDLREAVQSLRSGGGRKVSSARLAAELQVDVNTLALVCMGLVATLVEKGVITELELQMHLRTIDGLDAVEDEGLDPDVLRGAMGLKKPKRKALPTRAKLKKNQPKGGPVPPKKKR
ncbi:MAG: hypothetical protein H6839_01390 [Planctomycetes bacterium]|nr:hypothetical protein [Planctomycetota bacterium]